MLQLLKSLYLWLPPHSRGVFEEMMWHEGGFCKTTHVESQLTESSLQSASPEDTRVATLREFSMLSALGSNLTPQTGRPFTFNVNCSKSPGHYS